MKKQNAIVPHATTGLSNLKRASNLIRITSEILGKPVAPARNRTDEQGRKQGRWIETELTLDERSPLGKARRWLDWSTLFFEVGFVGNLLSAEGDYVDGKRQGHWVLRFVDDEVFEGSYLDDEKHGHWVFRMPGGTMEDHTVAEGQYVNGKRQGHWVFRISNGDVHEGPYVDGKEHGHWVERCADGNVWEGEYVDGKMHGRWVLRFTDGEVVETCWENGKKVNC